MEAKIDSEWNSGFICSTKVIWLNEPNLDLQSFTETLKVFRRQTKHNIITDYPKIIQDLSQFTHKTNFLKLKELKVIYLHIQTGEEPVLFSCVEVNLTFRRKPIDDLWGGETSLWTTWRFSSPLVSAWSFRFIPPPGGASLSAERSETLRAWMLLLLFFHKKSQIRLLFTLLSENIFKLTENEGFSHKPSVCSCRVKTSRIIF